jgi:cation:H+ antiporter
LINSIKVNNSFYTTDWPVKILASFLLFVFLWFNKDISRLEGIFFLFLLVVFLIYLIKKNKQVTTDFPSENEVIMPNYLIVIFMVLGVFSLWAGSELLVKGAVNLAESFGVSERIIAVTVVSVGTSIPELASSIIAAIKKEADISIGNIIGSNIFNILCVLGITAIIKPIENIDEKMLSQDIYWMLGFALLLMPLVLLPKRGSLFFKEGILLLVAYAAFLYFTLS